MDSNKAVIYMRSRGTVVNKATGFRYRLRNNDLESSRIEDNDWSKSVVDVICFATGNFDIVEEPEKTLSDKVILSHIITINTSLDGNQVHLNYKEQPIFYEYLCKHIGKKSIQLVLLDDVKEFIKQLKKELWSDEACNIVDKLAGERFK